MLLVMGGGGGGLSDYKAIRYGIMRLEDCGLINDNFGYITGV